ncbi:NlpC/P60 family protein [Streptomyces sp. NPDC051130]|uniref:C40 family peptidase n=1 Tax=Streptomyces sp. NPDC051130 TaxID=3157223 RepID=UPI003417DB1A
MSHTAHIPSHRKPRRSTSKLAVRAGVAGGVLSTLAMAGTASASPSAEPVAETTLEMPVLSLDLTADVASAVTTAAENTRVAAVEAAVTGELNAQEESARSGAAAEAKQAKEEAQQKAEKKAKEEADRKADAERATRSAGRTTLQTASASAGTSDDGEGTVTAPATGSASAIINFARNQVGKAYVMGGTGPSSYDCSGLVQAAYRQAGISLPRMSQDQSAEGTSVSLSNLQPGDVLYWGSRGNAYHVALYVGGGKFVGAQNPSTGIVERSLSYDMPTGAVRIL